MHLGEGLASHGLTPKPSTSTKEKGSAQIRPATVELVSMG